MNNRTILVGVALLSFACSNALAAYCEDIHPNYKNGGGTKFGPFDYRDATLQKRERGTPLQLVEEAHFTERVRTLKGGNTTQHPGGDISYTLWAFPNHHQALLTLINYTLKYNNDQPPQMSFSTECYFKRAIQWRPDDPKAYSVYGIYLYKKARFNESITQFLEAINLDPENGNSFYNLGLAYFENKEYEKALEAAHSAYARGFRWDGLKNKLTRAGRWKDMSTFIPDKSTKDIQ